MAWFDWAKGRLELLKVKAVGWYLVGLFIKFWIAKEALTLGLIPGLMRLFDILASPQGGLEAHTQTNKICHYKHSTLYDLHKKHL